MCCFRFVSSPQLAGYVEETLTGAPTFLHPISSFPLKAGLIRNRLEMLRVEDSAYKHRTKIQKRIWFLPNYAVFALDEGVVNKFYFQLHTLCCFS